MSPLFKDARELLPLIFILTLAASLVYIAHYPDLPKIEMVNEAPRQTGSQDYQEPPVSNPQVIIVHPPPPAVSGVPSSTVHKAASGILNTLVMVAFVFLGGFGIYLLIKYRKRIAEYTLAFAFGFVTIVAVAFFVEKTFILIKSATGFLPELWYRAVWGGLSLSLGIFVAKAVISRGISGRKRRVALMMFCLLASALMATVVPVFIILPLVLCMVVYDLYAVKYGPIKKIAEYHDSLDIMVVYEMGGWGLGFGDLIFYSILTSSSLSYTMIYISRFAFYDASWLVGVFTPWVVSALVTIAILIGFTKSLRFPEHKRLKPGLPIPILAGCGVFGLCILVLQLVNYFGWGWFVPLL